jgi:homoserine O-succinyltransferase
MHGRLDMVAPDKIFSDARVTEAHVTEAHVTGAHVTGAHVTGAGTAGAHGADAGRAWPGRRRPAATLTIGLVNNMPDAALAATEQQFRTLFAATGDPRTPHFIAFTLPGIARGEAARARLAGYPPFAAIPTAGLDLLIVTGAEPRAADLRDEPYWPALTGLLDWAEATGVPTVLSCLAAHAAVLHRDGIARVRLAEKCFGVFEHRATRPHPLTHGLPDAFLSPHSRWHELPEAALVAQGWQVLTRAAAVGPDLFVRQRRGLTLCFQGHPEYAADTLLREYRRDVRRFLVGARPDFPPPPHGVLTADALAALAQFRARARAGCGEALLGGLPPLVPRHEADAARDLARDLAPWGPAAAVIWRNLLGTIGQAGIDQAGIDQAGIGQVGQRQRGAACST